MQTDAADIIHINEATVFNKKYLTGVSIVAALGGLLFGFDTAIISGTMSFIKPYFNLDDIRLGWTVSCILIGCAIGAALAGKLSDVTGRKKVLLLCGFLFAFTGIGTGMATELWVFILFRISGGIAVGAAAMAAPMYIAETVPAKYRGAMVALYQLAIVSGILLAYFSNYLLFDIGTEAWRWMFASQAAPSILFIICLFFVPESPRWMVQKNKTDAAKKVLLSIGDARYADGELKAIKHSFENSEEESLSSLLKPKFRKVLIIGITLAIFQQVTGVNAILYYAPEIFKQTGVNTGNALLQTISIGVVMFVFTCIAIWLVDKSGRKKLLFYGTAIMAISLILVATCFYYQYFKNYVVLLGILGYIIGFSVGLGAVVWVLLSEIFPNQIRAVALSAATLILWFADFLASFLFPIINGKWGGAFTMSLFAFLCILCCFFIKWKVPETKGKSLEELEQELTTPV